MPGVAAALGLLFLNLGIIAAVLVFSPTARGAPPRPRSSDRCFVCSTPDPETTASGYPICTACEDEYFRALR